MLDALLAGESDPQVLAELAKGRLRSKIPALREALAGRFRAAHHGFLVAQILAHVDFLDAAPADLDARVERAAAPFQQLIDRIRTIPGVRQRTAIMLLADCGADMATFRTAAHLASWAGICPGNNASGGKSQTGHTRHGSIALRTALTEAAYAAARTKGTYLAGSPMPGSAVDGDWPRPGGPGCRLSWACARRHLRAVAGGRAGACLIYERFRDSMSDR